MHRHRRFHRGKRRPRPRGAAASSLSLRPYSTYNLGGPPIELETWCEWALLPPTALNRWLAQGDRLVIPPCSPLSRILDSHPSSSLLLLRRRPQECSDRIHWASRASKAASQDGEAGKNPVISTLSSPPCGVSRVHQTFPSLLPLRILVCAPVWASYTI